MFLFPPPYADNFRKGVSIDTGKCQRVSVNGTSVRRWCCAKGREGWRECSVLIMSYIETHCYVHIYLLAVTSGIILRKSVVREK